MKRVIRKNPIIWMVYLPILSMKATVNQYPGRIEKSDTRACARAKS